MGTYLVCALWLCGSKFGFMYGDEYLGVCEYVNRSWMYDITVLINKAFQVMKMMSSLVSDIRWPSKIEIFGILGGGGTRCVSCIKG